jgi:hypothetical protein
MQSSLLAARIERTKQFLGSVLWGVGVAAPGMLGLLANGTELKALSWLSASTFSQVFLYAELLFVASIVVAVIAQWKLIGHIGRQAQLQQTLINTHLSTMKLIWQGHRHDSEESDKVLDPLERQLKNLADSLAKESGPLHIWYPRVQYGLLILAYLLMGVIIRTIDFI